MQRVVIDWLAGPVGLYVLYGVRSTARRGVEVGRVRPTACLVDPILVGYDPRRLDRAPVHFAVALARLTGASLEIASVQAEAPAPVSAELESDLLDDCTAALDDVEPLLRVSAIHADCVKLHGVHAARALHEEAERTNAALIVVGAAMREASARGRLGSTGRRLLHGSPCPVAVVPPDWAEREKFATVGVGYVDTPEGNAALHEAHALARRTGAGLRVVHVMRVTPAMHLEVETYVAGQMGKSFETVEGEHKLRIERELQARAAELGDDVAVEIDVVVADPDEDPADHIVLIAQHLDLLVLGSRGYGPLRATLLGSVSARVTAHATCPTIVLPRGVKASFGALTGKRERVVPRATAGPAGSAVSANLRPAT